VIEFDTGFSASGWPTPRPTQCKVQRARSRTIAMFQPSGTEAIAYDMA